MTTEMRRTVLDTPTSEAEQRALRNGSIMRIEDEIPTLPDPETPKGRIFGQQQNSSQKRASLLHHETE